MKSKPVPKDEVQEIINSFSDRDLEISQFLDSLREGDSDVAEIVENYHEQQVGAGIVGKPDETKS